MAGTGRIEITFERERKTLRSLLSFFNRGHRVEHADDPGIVPAVDISKAEHYLAALTAKHGPLPPAALSVQADAVATLVLDAAALSALAAGNPRARAYLEWAVRSKTRIVAPATVFLDPNAGTVAGLVADVVPIYASTAQLASILLAQSRLFLPIDALHVALASRLRPAAILTRDGGGMRALANAGDQRGVIVFCL